MSGITNKPATLCWSCANACGGCSWSDRSFTPVKGWKAKRTKIHGGGKEIGEYESYHVIKCPEYADDREQYKKVKGDHRWY